MKSILINQNYKMTKLSIRSQISINKRFYPGSGHLITAKNLIGCRLSVANCKSILRVFNKKNLPLDKAQEEQLYAFASKRYQESANRNEFFKNIRKIAHNEITIPAVFDHGTFATVNLIADLTRQHNLPLKFKESLEQVKNEKSKKQPEKGSSLEEKKKAFDERHDAMIKEIQIAKEVYEKNKTIMWDIMEKWHQYLETRSSVKPFYTLEEKEAFLFLEHVFSENTESKEVVLSRLHDKLQTLKEQSTLSNIKLLEKIEQDCFIEQDYLDKINAIKEAQKTLNTDVSLNNNAIALLARLANVASPDEANKPKLNREVYTLAGESPEDYGIKYTDKKPNPEEIMAALKNKQYFVIQSSEEIPSGQIISTAPLLHKTIVILTKDGVYKTSMLTSSKTDTELLSLSQECNLDPEATKKEQRFVVFSRFILFEDVTMTVDLLALAYTHSINLQGEDVHQKIIKLFEDKKDEWANNEVQEPMNITADILKNITKIFLENKLQIATEKYNNFLMSLKNMTEIKKTLFFEALLKEKEDFIKEQNEQKYLSKLTENFQKLLVSLNLFKKELKHQKEIFDEQEKKARINNLVAQHELKLKLEKEERERTGQQTPKEKREALQKQIKEKNEQKVLMIENTKSEKKK